MRADGFTLIELLIAMVVSGILVGAIFQLIHGQARFVGTQGAQEEVQQNGRAVLELVAGELRSVPGEGLVRADADAIAVRVPRVWGTVCTIGSGQVTLAVPLNVELTDAVNAGTGLVVNLGDPTAPDWSDALTVTVIDGGSEGLCGDLPIADVSELRTVSFSGTPSGTIQPGDRAYLYDLVEYDLGTTSGLEGLWVRRRQGGGSFQPLAGPIREGGTDPDGFQFRYFVGTGAAESFPLSDATRHSVDRVRLVVQARSRGEWNGRSVTETDSVTIFLRNR